MSSDAVYPVDFFDPCLALDYSGMILSAEHASINTLRCTFLYIGIVAGLFMYMT